MSAPEDQTTADASVPAGTAKRSNAYEMFILLLTVLSLLIMVVSVLPRLTPATRELLDIYDNVICVVFLFDFGLRLKRAPTWRSYFIGGRGWLDLIGSIPTFGLTRYGGLLRLARISRLTRITRLLRGQSKRQLTCLRTGASTPCSSRWPWR